MTYRSGKRHKVQETGRTNKNVIRLASKLQRFLNTGKVSKQDLKAIDNQFSKLVSGQGDKILQLLDQLKDRIPKARGKEIVEATCASWARWLIGLDSKKGLGYSSIRNAGGENLGAMLEAAVDAEADFFRMLIAYNSALASVLRNASYEVPDCKEISSGAEEIYEAFHSRQTILTKLARASPKPQLKGA